MFVFFTALIMVSDSNALTSHTARARVPATVAVKDNVSTRHGPGPPPMTRCIPGCLWLIRFSPGLLKFSHSMYQECSILLRKICPQQLRPCPPETESPVTLQPRRANGTLDMQGSRESLGSPSWSGEQIQMGPGLSKSWGPDLHFVYPAWPWALSAFPEVFHEVLVLAGLIQKHLADLGSVRGLPDLSHSTLGSARTVTSACSFSALPIPPGWSWSK